MVSGQGSMDMTIVECLISAKQCQVSIENTISFPHSVSWTTVPTLDGELFYTTMMSDISVVVLTLETQLNWSN